MRVDGRTERWVGGRAGARVSHAFCGHIKRSINIFLFPSLPSLSLPQGLDSYNRAIELLPSKTGDAWLVYLNKATTELALDRIDAAITDLDLARVLHGQPDMLLFANKGLALERKGKFGPALESFEFAVMSKPKDVQPWWLRCVYSSYPSFPPSPHPSFRYSLVLFQEQQDIKSMEVMRKVSGKFGRVEEIKVALASK